MKRVHGKEYVGEKQARGPSKQSLAAVVIVIIMIISSLGLLVAFAKDDDRGDDGDVDGGAGDGGEPDPDRVSFATSDGFTIVGTLKLPENDPVGAVVLVHGMWETRAAWNGLVPLLLDRGYATLAIDVRMFGESTNQNGGTFRLSRDLSAEEYGALMEKLADMDRDITASVNTLKEKLGPGVSVTVIGASIGANAALNCADGNPDVASIVLLSPGEGYAVEVEDPSLGSYGDRPLFVAAAQGDVNALGFSSELSDRATGPVMFREVPGSLHGTNLLTDPDLIAQLLDFLPN